MPALAGKCTDRTAPLAAALGERGLSVLAIDLDMNYGLTQHFGIDPEAFLGVGVNTGPAGGQSLDQTAGSERAVLLAHSHGRGDQLLSDLDLRCGTGLHC